MVRTIILNGRTVEYEFVRKKVKNINLRVRTDGTVFVSAARSVPIAAVESFLRAQTDRILRALDRFASAPPAHTFQAADGEEFLLFGETAVIQVTAGKENRAQLTGSVLTLSLRDPDDAPLRLRTFQQWHTEMCKTVFSQVCDRMLPLLKDRRIPRPAITIRTMTSRWGSCRPQKQAITLNSRLAEHPIPCIEFVVLHELVHFVHPDHSQHFYDLLTAQMPDWRDRKRLLESGKPPLSTPAQNN